MNHGTVKSASQNQFESALAREASSLPDVPLAIDRLSRATEDLHALLGVLDNRLIPVLRPATQGDGCAIITDGYATPLADSIESHARSIHAAADRVRDLLNRIQL